MSTTIPPSDEELFQRFRNEKDHAAFEMLFHRYSQSSGDGLLDWHGENLMDWVMYEKGINAFDADDIVADCWAYLIINQPEIRENFGAYTYQKLDWLVRDYRDRRRKPKKPWLTPWRARTNYFPPLDDKPFPIITPGEVAESRTRDRNKSRQFTYFLDHAIMQEAMRRLPVQEQQTLRLYWIEGLTLEEAAQAANATFATFRTRHDQAFQHLSEEFFRIRERTETLEDQTKLLSEWGDIRPDLHWVPDDENQEVCSCPRCEPKRLKRSFFRKCDSMPAMDVFNVTICKTDRDGYKLPGQKVTMSFFMVGSGKHTELETVA
jgi:RNA polymerase sigma factor (sigma-70 family)